MEEIKSNPKYIKELLLPTVPIDPPRTITGEDMPLDDIKKELLS